MVPCSHRSLSGILIGSSASAGLASVPNRQRDTHNTQACLSSYAMHTMRPKNYSCQMLRWLVRFVWVYFYLLRLFNFCSLNLFIYFVLGYHIRWWNTVVYKTEAETKTEKNAADEEILRPTLQTCDCCPSVGTKLHGVRRPRLKQHDRHWDISTLTCAVNETVT